ncbi:type I polyketide synthase [Chryseosolibacter indicus]|uniref:Acyltransferase domain-containing protein n=1 Tax=Chryseosolibacter indicus TaxID=2782351 RepID=A0ABS5VS88_9BACT|nr:type I polyketide synthase [Chryseosolibacter indicus]MBT1704051.1 acyltransferase domain-containing protein [Chryseosolibacter indicus]
MNPSSNTSHSNAIAIVGVSCRFPNVNSIESFWDLLSNGKDTIAEISKERWDASALYDPDPLSERKTQQKHASLLSDIHDFDPLFFNISPAEAIEMSPSQKLMMELAWEAIESSTIPFKKIQGKNVGVYVGNIWSDFEHYRKFKNAKATLHSAVGMSSNVIANRVSFALGFTGPSLVIDTGCSASLVALHLACQSLLSNESEMTIIGGINHILDPGKYIELTKFGGLSVKGRCSTFDVDADGFVRGEGGGVLLLKKLSDAERDGDKIFAVIKSTAVNNNGFNDTLPATSTEGQISLLEKAYEAAGIRPDEVHYMEAHGTGTKLGDPNEARAIGEFFKRGREESRLRIGSVKTNLGHTEATAGIAGLIKVVLAMQHKMLPPNLNFNSPNPNIDFDDLKLEVQKDLTSWPVKPGETLKAGVNSFGWGGTNAHAVLEEYVAKLNTQGAAAERSTALYSLPLTAKSPQALLDYAKAYAALLEGSDEETFKNICIATAFCKAEFDHRILFSGTSREEVLQEIKNFVQDNVEALPYMPLKDSDKVVFVFPGQGAQWLGMGRDLFPKEPVFKKAIEELDDAFKPFTDWSLLEQLNATPEKSRLSEIDVIQPSICAMQIALAKLWLSWGIKPHAVVGHSMGEVAAAYISGAISLNDAARIICTRSRLMKTVSGKGGAMAVTELSHEDALKVVAGYAGKLSVAVNNSPKSTVLAGDKASIDEVMAQLESKGLFCRLVKVDVASHSPQMDPLKEDLRKALQSVRPQQSTVPFFSTVFNKVMEGTSLDADYWVNNLRGTVQFASVIQQLIEDQHVVFIEANPHPVLVNAVNECAAHSRAKVITVASTAREKDEQKEMLKNLNDLFNKGYSINWEHFYSTNKVPQVALPHYPFQRERYEIEDYSKELELNKETAATYPLLGSKINLANIQNIYFWQSIISVSKFPYLKDHLINNKIELPTACYLEMVFEAMNEIFKDTTVRIEQMNFSRQLVFAENEVIDVQLKLQLCDDKGGQFYIYKREGDSWVELSNGSVVLSEEKINIQVAFDEIEYQAPSYTDGSNYYNLLRSIGFDYGKHFHAVTGVDKITNQSSNQILFSIKPDAAVKQSAGKYIIHPALISSFMQPLFGQLISILEEGNFLNVTLENIQKLQITGAVNYERELRGLMMLKKLERATDALSTWSFSADILIANYDNTAVMSIYGLKGTAGRIISAQMSNGKKNSGSEALQKFSQMELESEKIEVLQQILITEVSKIIKIPQNRIKGSMTFKGMGLDSLMAVQLRNQLEKDFNIKLPVGMFWSHPSISDYTIYLKSVLMPEANAEHTSASKGHEKNWFNIPKPNPDALFKVFCFHDAGGSASLFDGWENLLDSDKVEFIAVEMPGRGRRLEEAPFTELKPFLDDIIPAIKPLLNKPYVFLGHSMGGLLAFEIIREFRRTNFRMPEKLFISSTSGLGAYDKSQVDPTLSNDELVHLYPHLHIDNIGDVELQSMLVNILRADLQFLYSHKYTVEKPLDIPIIAIHGSEDERVKRHQIEAWEKETSVLFRLISRSGEHRYIAHDGEYVANLILQEIGVTEEKVSYK